MRNIILILAFLITLAVSAQNPIVVSQTYTPQGSAPALTEGRVYYDNIAKVLYVYNGTSWVDLTASGGAVDFTNAASSPGNSTWLGFNAGQNDDATDNFNVGIGVNALNAITYQIHHTAVGYEAGSSISGDSFDNSIFGYRAGEDLTTGDYNVLLGSFAGDNLIGNQDHNVFIGYDAGSSEAVGDLTTATTSIAIGGNTKMNADSETNQIVIGYATTGNGTNTVTIGNGSITDNYFNGNIEAEGNFNPDADFGGNVGGNDLSFDQINSGTYYLRDATEKDWYMNHVNNDIDFYQETAADSESYTKRYSLNDGGTPASPEDLITKAFADANYASAATLPVSDATSIVEGSVDDTKEMRFEVDGLTTATVRVLTVQDADGTIAYSADIPTISDVAYNATTWNANTDGASKNSIRDEMETKVINTISGRTNRVSNVTGIQIEDAADIALNGTVGAGEVVICSDCSPMEVIATADWNTANGAVAMDGWKGADDRTIDEGTITLSDCDPGEALTVYILRTSAPTLAGTGLTFNNIGTVSFTTATEQKIEFEVAIDGTTIDYFYVDR